LTASQKILLVKMQLIADRADVVWKQTHHKNSSALKSAALSVDSCFLPKKICCRYSMFDRDKVTSDW